MNKHFTQNILRFLLLIVIAPSSGCTQSVNSDSLTVNNINTMQPSQTPIPVIMIATMTPIPCISAPQTSRSDVEKEAEEWFLSSKQMVADRQQYIASNKWENFCVKYQNAILNKEYWASAPIEIALQIRGFPYEQGPFPTSIYSISSKHHEFITIIILEDDLMDDSIKAIETRFDLIQVDRLWQLYWYGIRLQCRRPYEQPHDWVISSCS